MLTFANIGVTCGTNLHVSQNDIFSLLEKDEVVSQPIWAWNPVSRPTCNTISWNGINVIEFPLPKSIYNSLIDWSFWKVAVAVIATLLTTRSELFETSSVFNSKRSSVSSTLHHVIMVWNNYFVVCSNDNFNLFDKIGNNSFLLSLQQGNVQFFG